MCHFVTFLVARTCDWFHVSLLIPTELPWRALLCMASGSIASGRDWGLDQFIPLQQCAQGLGCWEGQAPASQSLTGCSAGRLYHSCHFLSQEWDPEIQIVVLLGYNSRGAVPFSWSPPVSTLASCPGNIRCSLPEDIPICHPLQRYLWEIKWIFQYQFQKMGCTPGLIWAN